MTTRTSYPAVTSEPLPDVDDDIDVGWLATLEWPSGHMRYDYDDPEANIEDNCRRAGHGATAVLAYAARVYHDVARCGEPAQQAIYDLLGDLMHLCDALGLVFEEMCDKASTNYVPELYGEF